MNKEIKLPVQNYKGEYSVRHLQPLEVCYKETEYHGACWHFTGYDLDKQAKRDFELDKIVRGVVHFTLRTLGESAHESKVDGIMNAMKGDK